MISHWDAYYFRTRASAEVELIVEGPFGVLAIEIKYGIKTSPDRLRHLDKFIKDNHLEFSLLINQAKEAHWLTRHISSYLLLNL